MLRRGAPPLPRRRTDRVEDLVAWLLTTLGLFAVLGSLLVGHAAHQAAHGNAGAASPVRAVLLADAPPRSGGRPAGALTSIAYSRWPGRAPTVWGTSPR